MDHHHVLKDKNKEVIVAYHIFYDLIRGNLPIPPCVPEKNLSGFVGFSGENKQLT